MLGTLEALYLSAMWSEHLGCEHFQAFVGSVDFGSGGRSLIVHTGCYCGHGVVCNSHGE
jgi:hypothetical protein